MKLKFNVELRKTIYEAIAHYPDNYDDDIEVEVLNLPDITEIEMSQTIQQFKFIQQCLQDGNLTRVDFETNDYMKVEEMTYEKWKYK